MSESSRNTALDWVIFKIAQRCNINCSYCYVYNQGDDSWKSRPKFVSDDVSHALGHQISLQAEKYGLTNFNVEFHGGEPLLIGVKRFRDTIEILNSYCNRYKITYHLQTNGLLLNKEWLEAFNDLNVSFGVSLDGPPDIADKFRVNHRGEGTTKSVSNILLKYSRTPEFQACFGGALCVIANPFVDEKRLLSWFRIHKINSIDFLLPDANYASPLKGGLQPIHFLDFLKRSFDYWVTLEDDAPNIRLFEYIIRGLTGEITGLDSLGGDLAMLCVVESDGTIGVSDVGRICPPLREDKLNVFSSSLDKHADAYQLDSIQILHEKCVNCNQLSACRGGYLPHRYDGQSFKNPSYYCEALFGIAEHIQSYLHEEFRRVQGG